MANFRAFSPGFSGFFVFVFVFSESNSSSSLCILQRAPFQPFCLLQAETKPIFSLPEGVVTLHALMCRWPMSSLKNLRTDKARLSKQI